MASEAQTSTIEIRPTSSVFATYRRLSYKPWYAVAEFVDNSTQSFYDREVALTEVSETITPLEVRIYHDKNEKTLTVVDNAYGMSFSDFQRAIQLNKPPVGPKTRNEFGMGLKTAACWMGSKWSVRSKALGATEEYSATIDVERLASDEPETIQVAIKGGLDPQDHYTIIQVEGMYRVFQTKTTGRIKELLGSMYRRDLATGRISIYWNDDALAWEGDPIYREVLPDGTTLDWSTHVDVAVGSDGLRATGWVGIRLPGNARRAGLHLLRHGRIVVGGPAQGWKPHDIYGAPNSFASQRIVGELELDGWPVTQAKDGFDWDGGLEEELISALLPEVAPLVEKASGSLKEDGTDNAPSPNASDAALAVDTIAAEVGSESVAITVDFFEEEPLVQDSTPEEEEALVAIAQATGEEPTLTAVGEAGIPTIKWWLLDKEHPLEPFVRLAMPQASELHVFVNLRHPFVEEHVGSDQAKLVLYLKMLLADALVERAAKRRVEGVTTAAIRKFKDSFLRTLPASWG